MKKVYVDYYKAFLTVADAKGCIVKIDTTSTDREAWVDFDTNKYLYRSWLVSGYFIQAIYTKDMKNNLRLLDDIDVKNLYDELDSLEMDYV